MNYPTLSARQETFGMPSAGKVGAKTRAGAG